MREYVPATRRGERSFRAMSTEGAVTERYPIVAVLRDRLQSRQEIVFACLHGSFLEGRSYRDIDIAVLVDSLRVGPAGWRRYEASLAVELQTHLRQPVDVRILNDASLAFRYHATAGLPLVVRDPEGLADFRARTWDDYFDFQPFARRYLQEVLGG